MTSNDDFITKARTDAALEMFNLENTRFDDLRRLLDLSPRQRLVEVTWVRGDAIACIADRDDNHLWGAVVGHLTPNRYFGSHDEALVHLLAIRHDRRTTEAHTYACRVLRIPTDE